jgi:hypothetical protein
MEYAEENGEKESCSCMPARNDVSGVFWPANVDNNVMISMHLCGNPMARSQDSTRARGPTAATVSRLSGLPPVGSVVYSSSAATATATATATAALLAAAPPAAAPPAPTAPPPIQHPADRQWPLQYTGEDRRDSGHQGAHQPQVAIPPSTPPAFVIELLRRRRGATCPPPPPALRDLVRRRRRRRSPSPSRRTAPPFASTLLLALSRLLAPGVALADPGSRAHFCNLNLASRPPTHTRSSSELCRMPPDPALLCHTYHHSRPRPRTRPRTRPPMSCSATTPSLCE